VVGESEVSVTIPVEREGPKLSYRAKDSSITNYIGDVPFTSKENASFSSIPKEIGSLNSIFISLIFLRLLQTNRTTILF